MNLPSQYSGGDDVPYGDLFSIHRDDLLAVAAQFSPGYVVKDKDGQPVGKIIDTEIDNSKLMCRVQLDNGTKLLTRLL